MTVESVRQFQSVLALIDSTLDAAVTLARHAEFDPADAFSGLSITDEEVARLLARGSMPGLWHNGDRPPLLPLDGCDRFNALLQRFDLTELDGYLLLLAAAPEVDRRYERLYGFLQDDVTQRYLTVNLAINLLGSDVTERFAVWKRLTDASPLLRYLLLTYTFDTSRVGSSYLSRQIKIELRVLNHLLGLDDVDERLKQDVHLAGAGRYHLDDEALQSVRRNLPQSPVIYLIGLRDSGRRETAAALCNEIGLPLLLVDASATTKEMIPELFWQLVLREGLLRGAALLIHEWDELPAQVWEAVQTYPFPLFLCGKGRWDPSAMGRRRRVLRLRFESPAVDERYEAWCDALPEIEPAVAQEMAWKFRLTRSQIDRAAATALDLAASNGSIVTAADIYAGIQHTASVHLSNMARRIPIRYNWSDLILPQDQLTHLREICARARFSDLVREKWGYGRKIAVYRGVSALFAGESGTGKTLAAQVIAADLGLPIYQIDLSAVVSKYIGETEKNLSAIFDESQLANALLFFDEADALFGKRSEVKDAHDRYANIETAYLLQRIESYDGVAIMATNLKQNLDDAFTRRFDFIIDFPQPDAESRRLIWRAHFPSEAPLASDVDLTSLADRYHLAGGNIRNAALHSAFLAAADGGVITMEHVRQSVRRERQKMGRLLEE